MVGGGSIFGPEPRDYTNQLPAGMRRLARKSALSLKAKEGLIRVIEDFSTTAPKTKEMVGVLKALELGSTKTLLLLAKPDANVVKSGRNIPRLHVAQADKASTYDFVNTQVLLIQKSALEVLQNTFKRLRAREATMTGILKRPIVTEKMTALQEKGQYAFEVSLAANKISIAQAVAKKFNVTVLDVRTIRYKGKAKSQMTKRGRFEGRTSAWKKAIVRLKEGEKIEFFQNV